MFIIIFRDFEHHAFFKNVYLFYSPIVTIDPFYSNIIHLYVELFNEYMTEQTATLYKASVNINIIPTNNGFKVKHTKTYRKQNET